MIRNETTTFGALTIGARFIQDPASGLVFAKKTPTLAKVVRDPKAIYVGCEYRFGLLALTKPIVLVV